LSPSTSSSSRSAGRDGRRPPSYQTSFNGGISISPAVAPVSPANIHIALGVVYLDRYRLDAALREFSEAERLEPRRADAHTFQALVYTISNKPAAAAAALAKASAIDPRRSAVVYGMSRQLALAGRDAEATAALRAFVAARKTRLEDRSAADPGSAPFQRVALLRQVPDVAPIFPPALYAEPFALLAQGDYTAAVALFRQAIQRDPIIGDALGRERLGQGSAALRAGNVRSAIEHLQAAVSAEPDRAEAHRLPAVALREADQHEGSIEAFRAAIRLNPGASEESIVNQLRSTWPRRPARCRRR